MTIEKTLNGAELTVVVAGRLDTITAPVLEKTINNGSLKLIVMSKSTQTDAGWKNTDAETHEKKMIEILENACYNITK